MAMQPDRSFSLGLGPDWPGMGLVAPEDDDECVREMEPHLAALSRLLEDAEPSPRSTSTLRRDAPEFVPMQQPTCGVDGPALTSGWTAQGTYRVAWRVPSSKLLSKDKIVVSPGFTVHPASTFKLLLAPRAKRSIEDAPAFGSTRYGALQLKCVEDRSGLGVRSFRLFVGDVTSAILQHNFSSCAVASDDSLWDLRAEVDGGSRTLVVGVEFVDP